MEPLIILVLLPVLIGVVSERLFADTTSAALAAAIGTAVLVYTSLKLLAPDETWNGLAALLVSPLPIALSLGAVVVCCGRSHVRRGKRRGRVEP
jgi:hypothetical protein